jgi:hypothetical protein
MNLTDKEWAILTGVPEETQRRYNKQGYCPYPRRKISGISKDSAYGCWENMIQRCTNPRSTKYYNYGGRGIKVSPEFLTFDNFIKHIGPRPSAGYSIDRIDNDGNYEPGNVRWATYVEQRANMGRKA